MSCSDTVVALQAEWLTCFAFWFSEMCYNWNYEMRKLVIYPTMLNFTMPLVWASSFASSVSYGWCWNKPVFLFASFQPFGLSTWGQRPGLIINAIVFNGFYSLIHRLEFTIRLSLGTSIPLEFLMSMNHLPNAHHGHNKFSQKNTQTASIMYT